MFYGGQGFFKTFYAFLGIFNVSLVTHRNSSWEGRGEIFCPRVKTKKGSQIILTIKGPK
jgi:hypothetical protein